tara:strand:+ start:2900 stop:3169 length:270 start_codon:yes stop_codon:yes gene_type:complete
MQIFLLLPLFLGLSLPAQSRGLDEVHEKCKEAKDYFGCVKTYKGKTPEFNFSKMKQLRLKRVDKLRQCIYLATNEKELQSCRPKPTKVN